jgi:hypothetical protein
VNLFRLAYYALRYHFMPREQKELGARLLAEHHQRRMVYDEVAEAWDSYPISFRRELIEEALKEEAGEQGVKDEAFDLLAQLSWSRLKPEAWTRLDPAVRRVKGIP